MYTYKQIDEYFTERRLIYSEEDCSTEIPLSCGVSQGSVIGSTLWNILYDDLFETPLPGGVEFLAFAENVTMVATAEETTPSRRNSRYQWNR